MKKVCCFGELLLRLPPAADGQWIQQQAMPVFVGGAELNVATALAQWQIPVKYFTALPDNVISSDIISYLSDKGMDTSAIRLCGERIGLYYLRQGQDMKSGKNVFDRKHSSFSTLVTGIVDWEEVLHDTGWLHVSAIAPAVSATAAALLEEALQVAAKNDIPVSLDLNYREGLWQYGVQPEDVLWRIAPYCHVIMGNIWSAERLLGVRLSATATSGASQEEWVGAANESARQIMHLFPRCQWVANTFRFSNEEKGISYFATLHQSNNTWQSPRFTTSSIVEQVGSGDCFMAGLLYGLLQQFPPESIIGFAAAAAFGKLQEKGDATSQSADQIWKTLQAFNHLLQST